jgi:hypothetical protein
MPAHVERLLSAGRGEHGEPLSLEDASKGVDVGWLVIDDEQSSELSDTT